jgi:3-carboxy-cis,cis-muconate cycloisomerase
MPHKANPVGCGRIVAAAARAPGLAATLLAVMGQEEQRGLGGWHAEWEVLPDLFRLASAALEAGLSVVTDGEFDSACMRANLDATRGLVMAETVSVALAARIGKAAAHALVEDAARRSQATAKPLKQILAAEPEVAKHLNAARLDALFAPEKHTGVAPEFTARAVAAWRMSRQSKETDLTLFREGANGRK